MASILKDQINLRQTGSHTYTVSYHTDWSIGSVMHGGCVAALIHHTATTHLSTTLAARNQPDILTLHFEFLRGCELHDSTITVTELKIGAGTSTLQLQLSQNGQIKVIALVTSTNFDKPVGPTVPTAWSLHPEPKPIPDFDKILAHKPDEHWLPFRFGGEVFPLAARLLILNSRDGFPVDGVCDAWNSFTGEERMDATSLAMMADIIPSNSDTLLRNGGIYDARSNFTQIARWAEENPGVPAELTKSLKEAMRMTIFNYTVTLDIEFKRRLPKDGVKWVFTRAATRTLRDGRMDLDVTICDEKMEILCLARQAILVLDAKRKFGGGKVKSAL